MPHNDANEEWDDTMGANQYDNHGTPMFAHDNHLANKRFENVQPSFEHGLLSGTDLRLDEALHSLDLLGGKPLACGPLLLDLFEDRRVPWQATHDGGGCLALQRSWFTWRCAKGESHTDARGHPEECACPYIRADA